VSAVVSLLDAGNRRALRNTRVVFAEACALLRRSRELLAEFRALAARVGGPRA